MPYLQDSAGPAEGSTARTSWWKCCVSRDPLYRVESRGELSWPARFAGQLRSRRAAGDHSVHARGDRGGAGQRLYACHRGAHGDRLAQRGGATARLHGDLQRLVRSHPNAESRGGGPQDATLRRSTDWVHTALVQGNLVRDFVKYDDQPYSLESVAGIVAAGLSHCHHGAQRARIRLPRRRPAGAAPQLSSVGPGGAPVPRAGGSRAQSRGAPRGRGSPGQRRVAGHRRWRSRAEPTSARAAQGTGRDAGSSGH